MTSAEDNFELACFLAKAGLPLDTKFETRAFSHGYSKHWFRMMNHHAEWLEAVLKYSERPTSGEWRKVQRLYRRFMRSANDFFVYTEKSGGDELQIGRVFCQKNFMPVVARWAKICSALKGGDAISLNIKELFLTDEPMRPVKH